jgi:predicted nuclease of predicted toxin-antitoxin system
LVGALSDFYPGSVHVSGAGLAAARDRAIWMYAAANGFVLVTKDEDFHRLSVLHGAPPKVIWIGLGNCSTDDCTGSVSGRSLVPAWRRDERRRWRC